MAPFGKDLTEGSIPRHLLLFSIPMLAGNAMQIGYSLINTIWVGHLVGENAVGAIGVSLPVLYVLFAFAMGMSIATTIVISQYYGAKDYRGVERAAACAFSLSLILAAALTVAGLLLSDHLLRLMATPPENFSMASTYLRITLAGFVLFYFGLLVNFMLRGIGDTITPLVFMSVALGLNAVLDPFFIGGFGPFPRWGLNGAAYATLVSQAAAITVNIVYLNRKQHFIAFHPRKLTLDKHLTLLLFKIGFPSIVQQSLVSIGSLFISAFVNAFGAPATNAFGAVGRVDMVAFMPAMSMSMAVSALTGQNLGARKTWRVKEVFRWGIVMTSSITILISLVVVLFSRAILMMFGLGEDPRVMEIGVGYLRIVGACYLFFAIMFISNGVINGAGHTTVTMIFTLLSQWLVRVPASWALSKTDLGLHGIWIAVALSFAVTMSISLLYYFSGRWKRPTVIKAPPILPLIE
jgi:putative MATE family efflux protein